MQSACAQSTTVLPPRIEQKIESARASGTWLVEEGEQLYRICRFLASDAREARQIAREVEALNPNALIRNDPSRLVVGARLRLPERLVIAQKRPPQATPLPSANDAKPPMEKEAATATRDAPAEAGLPSAGTFLPKSKDESPATPAASVGAAPPAYVDRLIDPAAAEQPQDATEGTPRDESPGLRTWAVEARAEHREASSSERTESQALGFRYGYQTLQYGDLTLVGQTSRFDPGATDIPVRHSRTDATLFHDNFALTADYSASSALGVVRPTLPAWLSTSYRVSIAPSLVQGAATTVTGAGGDFRVALGQLGRYGGFGIQQFERTSGRLFSASLAQLIAADWLLGAAAIAIRDSREMPDHNAVSLALEHPLAGPGSKVLVQVAGSDKGDGAGWVDAYLRDGRLNQRFGAFQVGPEFRFGESAAARDSRGAYWRGDYRIAGNFYGGGVEVVQDNLRRDPSRGGNDNVGAFANVTLRLDRSTQVGAGVSLRNEHPRVAGAFERNVGQANLSLSRSWAIGQSRIDWNTTTSRPVGTAAERSQALNWNQDWPALGPLAVSTLLGSSVENLTDRRVRRKTASIAVRGEVGYGVRVDSTFTFVDVDDTGGSERNYNTSAGLDWSPASDWLLRLTWYRNRIQPSADNPLSPFLKDNVVMLTARYEGSAGSPYPRAGGTAGRSGTGTIAGSVFFDENRDGARQATERGAANVIVILDERQSANTDAEGRFAFPLVPAGRHRVRIVIERLPLPWGLEDETPREVSVDVRTESRVDIGLTRIGP